MWKKIGIAAVIVLLLGGVAIAGVVRYVEYKLYERVEGEYFDSDGVQIHYTVQGSGPPVILVHGFAANADVNWRSSGTIDMLTPDYTVIAIDNRGHGLSGKPHDPAMYGEAFADDIIRLMDHLGIDKAAVCGYSMGGMVTLKLMEKYPERLVCAAPGGFGWEPEADRDVEMVERLASSLENGEGIQPLLEALQPEGEPLDPNAARVTNELIMRMNDGKALAAVVRSWIDMPPSEEALKNNEVPALTIVGSTDPLSKGAAYTGEITNNLKLHVIEGTDHVETFQTDEYNQVLKSFLDEHHAKPVQSEQPLAA